jgi:hypothetical protein
MISNGWRTSEEEKKKSQAIVSATNLSFEAKKRPVKLDS